MTPSTPSLVGKRSGPRFPPGGAAGWCAAKAVYQGALMAGPRWWDGAGFACRSARCYGENYPLVNCHIVAMERSTIFHGKIHYFDWAIFHCKLLVHQRVWNTMQVIPVFLVGNWVICKPRAWTFRHSWHFGLILWLQMVSEQNIVRNPLFVRAEMPEHSDRSVWWHHGIAMKCLAKEGHSVYCMVYGILRYTSCMYLTKYAYKVIYERERIVPSRSKVWSL